MLGKINSFQSLGAVDGPGIRYVVFTQGCPLRCSYCHNPETWDYDKGEQYEVDEIVQNILKYKSYFAKNGGVTVTGGEPLMQPDFLIELFKKLKEQGIHTCLDTSGICDIEKAKEVLKYTDLVLVDLKFTSEQDYVNYTGGSFKKVIEFTQLTEELDIPIWIRHVVVPTINDDDKSINEFLDIAKKFKNVEKIEILPFRKLCLEKYERLNLEFPFKDIEQLSVQRTEEIESMVKNRNEKTEN